MNRTILGLLGVLVLILVIWFIVIPLTCCGPPSDAANCEVECGALTPMATADNSLCASTELPVECTGTCKWIDEVGCYYKP